jgi:hypothetical protein
MNAFKHILKKNPLNLKTMRPLTVKNNVDEKSGVKALKGSNSQKLPQKGRSQLKVPKAYLSYELTD